MMEVSLHDILNAREARAIRQQELLRQYGCPLICFTMNIAGPVKCSPLILRGFREGLALLDGKLSQVLVRQSFEKPTGPEAYFVVDTDATRLKDICTVLEEATPLGRLFDMDVIGTDGAKLERNTQRGCLVCGKPGRACAARRTHPAQQLQEVTRQILRDHFAVADRARIAAAAVQSLLDEVYTTPKPGLVDRRNNGSHTDMTVRHFIDSANALAPYFTKCVKLGQETADQSPQDTFPLLRQAGLAAEKAMYEATGGVNTHKGAIYTLGVLCGSIGRLWSPEQPIPVVDAILTECADMVRSSAHADLASAPGKTAGEQLFLQHGLRGIRGEVAAGLPSVRNIGLPVYEELLCKGLSPNDAGAVTLLHLIAQVEDTNLYHRGGCTGAQWAANAANILLPQPTLSQLAELDDAFIARNLSPGGCADLLAVTYFLHKVKQP